MTNIPKEFLLIYQCLLFKSTHCKLDKEEKLLSDALSRTIQMESNLIKEVARQTTSDLQDGKFDLGDLM